MTQILHISSGLADDLCKKEWDVNIKISFYKLRNTQPLCHFTPNLFTQHEGLPHDVDTKVKYTGLPTTIMTSTSYDLNNSTEPSVTLITSESINNSHSTAYITTAVMTSNLSAMQENNPSINCSWNNNRGSKLQRNDHL